METQVNVSSTNFRNVILVIGVVISSIVVPLGLAIATARSAFEGKPRGEPGKEWKIYQGAFKDDELWFSVTTLPEQSVRLKRLDLTTGLERETNVQGIRDKMIYPFRMQDDVFYSMDSNTSVYHVTSTSSDRFPVYNVTTTYGCYPFVYEGQLTIILDRSEGGFQLAHLVDGQWQPGRKVLLPGRGRTFYDDFQRGTRVLRPITTQQPPTELTTGPGLAVFQCADQLLVFHMEKIDRHQSALCIAYRGGFEFPDDETETCSAMAPANSLHEVSGWQPIPIIGNDWVSVNCDRHGLILECWRSSYTLIRRTVEGEWSEIEGFTPQHGMAVHILADPTERHTYLIEEDQTWGGAKIHRIEVNTVMPPHLIIRGGASEYIARWIWLCSGLVIAWLLHCAIVLIGCIWLKLGRNSAKYTFVIRHEDFAPIGRRALGLVVDATLGIGVLTVLTYSQFRYLEVASESWTDARVAEFLLSCEGYLDPDLLGPGLFTKLTTFTSSRPFFGEIQYLPVTVVLTILEIIVLFGLAVWAEHRTGFSPGKLLAGIRTTSATLRPVTISQRIVRAALYAVDVPLLITPLPAAISIMLSPSNKRLGDRVADTIVVMRNPKKG